MGGRNSQGYSTLQHLTVKASVALQPHTHKFVNTVGLMLDSTGLPSFKGEDIIKCSRERFALGMNEGSAAKWMMDLVKNTHDNARSTAHDGFQLLVDVYEVLTAGFLNFQVYFEVRRSNTPTDFTLHD